MASIYALFQPVPDSSESDAYQTMNSVLDDLTPWSSRPQRRILIGGDFNVWLHTVYPTAERQALFQRLADLGMSDCIQAKNSDAIAPMPGCVCGQGDACENVRTRRFMNKTDSKPWQNDYLFASTSLLPSLTSWETLASEELWTKSDHCPVVRHPHPSDGHVAVCQPARFNADLTAALG